MGDSLKEVIKRDIVKRLTAAIQHELRVNKLPPNRAIPAAISACRMSIPEHQVKALILMHERQIEQNLNMEGEIVSPEEYARLFGENPYTGKKIS